MAAFRRGWSAILNAFYVGSNSTTELPQIDGLRALAVIFIMIDHAWGVAGGPNLRWTIPFTGQTVLVSGWVNRGDLGVPLFFILSGFLLPQSWLRAIHTGAPRPSLRNYFKRRLFRIVPAYYVCLFLLLVLFTPSLIPFDRVYSNDGLKELLAHLTFTHFLFTDTMGSWNIDSPMWTLTHEATFYLLLPLVFVLFIGRRSLVSVPAALVISVAWVYLSHLRMTALVDFVHQHSSDKLFFSATTIRTGFLAPQFPAYLFTFALGIALADWFVRTQLGLARRPGALAALALLAAGIVLLFASVKYIDFAQGEVASYFL
ncbi:MAG TPA: acyltransferase, partial [Dehalococcoidia bacterium]